MAYTLHQSIATGLTSILDDMDEVDKKINEVDKKLNSIIGEQIEFNTKIAESFDKKIKEEGLHNAYSTFIALLSNKLKVHKKDDTYCAKLLKDVVYNYTCHQYKNMIIEYDDTISKTLKSILSELLIKYEYDSLTNKTKIYVWKN